MALYQGHENLARERIERRDSHDWPVVAVALLLDIPVWTEDQDFFGSGVSIWTTDRVEIDLRGSGKEKPQDFCQRPRVPSGFSSPLSALS